jgi:hypothetical protein
VGREFTRTPPTGPPSPLDASSRRSSRAPPPPRAPAHAYLSSHLQAKDDAVLGRLPKKDSLKRMIRARRNAELFPHPPADMDFLVPDKFASLPALGDGEPRPFLLHDKRHGINRILVFASPKAIQFSDRAVMLWGDGTFDRSPQLFTQVYLVGTVVEGTAVPLFFALLPNKSAATYEAMWRAIKEAASPRFMPLKFIQDFEVAAKTGFRAVFTDAPIHACFFHLSQCLWRHVQEAGLQRRYQNDATFGLRCRMIAATAFAPPEKVVEWWNTFCDSEYCVDLDPLLAYWDSTYVGPLTRRGTRRQPVFPIPEWNVFHETLANETRVNPSEPYNRRFNAQINQTHPHLWKFISGLQREAAAADFDLLCAERGDPPARKNAKYAALQVRLHNLCSRVSPDTDPCTFLRGIAHNFTL